MLLAGVVEPVGEVEQETDGMEVSDTVGVTEIVVHGELDSLGSDMDETPPQYTPTTLDNEPTGPLFLMSCALKPNVAPSVTPAGMVKDAVNVVAALEATDNTARVLLAGRKYVLS